MLSLTRSAAFLFLLQICFSFITQNLAFECDPTKDCKAGTVGDMVPDPDNCNNYFLCIDSDGNSVPSDMSLSCGDGMYFNQSTGKCQTGDSCANQCLNICHTSCVKDLDLIPDPNDCTIYYICINDVPTETNCPSGTYFNGAGCSNSSNDCCDTCVPYCFLANTQVLDPYDCKSFYICFSANVVPDNSTHYNCPAGQQFDVESGLCEDGLSCTNYCSTKKMFSP